MGISDSDWPCQPDERGEVIRPDYDSLETRDELAYALAEACELEHLLLCEYLFAALTLKTDLSESGMSWPRLELIRGWKTTLLLVARQEMEHLGYACNLLAAIGAAPHFRIPAFPVPSRFYPAHARFELLPLNETALERFIHLERPKHVAPEHALLDLKQLHENRNATLVHPVDFDSVGDLYAKIRVAFEELDERALFVAPDFAQVSTLDLGLGDRGYYGMRIDPVVDRASALDAIQQIVAEGEGTGKSTFKEMQGTHFGRLRGIYDELREQRSAGERAGEPFEPARAVVSNPAAYDWGDNPDATVIDNPDSHEVLTLFDYTYQTMLLMLQRFYVNVDASETELDSLQATAFWPLMTMCIRPLGEVLSQLPATMDLDGPRAGPGFHALRTLEILPHRESTWTIFRERLDHMAARSQKLAILQRKDLDPNVRERLVLLGRDMSRMAANFSRILREGDPD